MKEILDIRFNSKLNSDISLLFSKISHKKRADFNEFITSISKPHLKNLDWWVQGPASRNTYSSPLFHYYCVLFLIHHLIQEKRFLFTGVIVNSLSFKLIVEELLSNSNINNCKVYSKYSFKDILKQIIKKRFLLFYLLFKKCFQLLVVRIISSNNIPDKPLVLIDTFLMPGYIDNDRWYGILWDKLSKEQKLETFFVPTLILTPFKDIIFLYRRAQLSVRNYIFKENYLTLKDVIFAFGHKKRIRKITIQRISLLGYEFSDLIEEELNNNSDINAVIESILTYRFIDRFNQEGLKVRLAIDWFEGQVLDKAWNMGFKNYFPKTKRFGYRPIVSIPFYLSTYPIPIERDAHVIPDVMALQGKGTVFMVKEFLSNLDTIVIPSFKYQYVWEFSENKLSQSKYVVLITLPNKSIGYTIFVINRLLNVCNAIPIKSDTTKFLIKPHPAQSLNKINKIKSNLPELPNYISLTEEKSFAKLLYLTNILITEASSTCLEAMACGIPVIMMENEEGLTYDPIPSRVSEHLFRKVRSQDDLMQALKYFINSTPENLKQQQLDSAMVREDYFEPYSQDGVDRFLDIVNK
jgi:hypothetical protein